MESSKSQAHCMGYATRSLKSLNIKLLSNPRMNYLMACPFDLTMRGRMLKFIGQSLLDIINICGLLFRTVCGMAKYLETPSRGTPTPKKLENNFYCQPPLGMSKSYTKSTEEFSFSYIDVSNLKDSLSSRKIAFLRGSVQ